MAEKNALVSKARLPPILPKSPSSIEAHESLIWLEETQTLHMYIAYTKGRSQEEIAVYMAILIGRMAGYGPWADNIQLLIHSRVIRLYESPSIYAQQVCEMKDLVNQINQSFEVLRHVNVRIMVDYANFQQMKLAASLFALETDWTLSYFIDGIKCLKRIDAESHLMRRLYGVYDRDFKV
ncbi:hypothetical protein NHQ30_009697 [Ciborinia camelliae]|nr:hypothetical protein NHQ30_009697 [Ciborinia camelliae]